MPPFGIIPPKTQSSKEQFLSALVMGALQGMQDRRKADYESQLMQRILAGESPQDAMNEKPASGLLNIIGRGMGGGTPAISNLSPFTQQVLATITAQKLRDPLETRALTANIEGRETQTEGMKEDIAAKREMRPLQTQNLRQEIENRRKEIDFIEQTNPDRARVLRAQADNLEATVTEQRKKAPIEIQKMQLSLDIAQEELNQAKDLAPMRKQHMQAQLDQAQQALETDRKRTPLEIQQLEAAIGQIKANTKRLTEGTAQEDKPFTPSETDSAVKMADSMIAGAKAADWGDYDYTKANLIKQYQKFRTLMKYESLSPATQKAYDMIWQSRIESQADRDEFEWSDEIFEEAKRTKAQSDEEPPDIKLKPYWGKLTDEQKQKVQKALSNGYTAEQIIKALK